MHSYEMGARILAIRSLIFLKYLYTFMKAKALLEGIRKMLLTKIQLLKLTS